MKELTDKEKDCIKWAALDLFNKSESKSECKTIISALDKLEIDTTEMKLDFDFYFQKTL